MINYVDKGHPCLDYSLLNYILGIYRTFIMRIFYSKTNLIEQEKCYTNRGPISTDQDENRASIIRISDI